MEYYIDFFQIENDRDESKSLLFRKRWYISLFHRHWKPEFDRSESPQPPIAIDWSNSSPQNVMDTSGSMIASGNVTLQVHYRQKNIPSKTPLKNVSLGSSLSPMQRTASEKQRRASSYASRRQSTIQVPMLPKTKSRLSHSCMYWQAAEMSGRRHSTTLIPLTFPQIHLIRTLWRQIYLTKVSFSLCLICNVYFRVQLLLELVSSTGCASNVLRWAWK